MGVGAHTEEKQPCANCGKEIYLSYKGEWFHYQNGIGPFMSRCDGQFRKRWDNRVTDWAQPTKQLEGESVSKYKTALCKNCEGAIECNEGSVNWQHTNGRFRCDGADYQYNDDQFNDWALPQLQTTVSSSYTHPLVEKAVSPQRQLLIDAADTVDGERQDQYGNAEDSFAVIAAYWSIYLSQQLGQAVTLKAKDVALMMVEFKLAREGSSPKRDNLLDGAGYFGLAQRIEEKS